MNRKALGFLMGVLAVLLTEFTLQVLSPAGIVHSAVFEDANGGGRLTTGFNEARAAREAREVVARRHANRALYHSVVQFELAKHNKHEEYAVMATAVLAAREGKSASEIVKAAARMRQAQHTLRTTRLTGGRSFSPEVSAMVVDAARMLGSSTGPIGGAAAALLARASLRTLDGLERDHRMYWAHRTHAEQRTVLPQAQRRILESYSEAYDEIPALREAGSIVIAPELAISPDSTGEEIRASSPDIQIRNLVELVAEAQQDHAEMTRRVAASLHAVRDLQKQFTLGASAKLETIEDLLRSDQASRAKAQRDERRRQANAVKVRGAQATVYLAATLIGFNDPKLGHQLQTIGDATISVYRALETFDRVSTGFSDLKGFASAALSADLVGAALAVVGLFVGTDTDPHTMIAREIGELRNQVEQVRHQMHHRFDLVDKRLTNIHVDLVRGLDKLSQELRRNRASAVRHSEAMQAQLQTQFVMLSDLYPLTVDRSTAILASIRGRALGPCQFRRRHDSHVLDGAEYDRCVSAIRALALDGELELQQIPAPQSPENVAHMISFPDATASIAAQAFRRRQSPDAAVRAPTQVVGPAAWLALIRAHEQFLRDWPEHRGRLRENVEFANAMRRYRTQLDVLIEAIGDDLMHHAEAPYAGSSSPRTAIGALVKEVRRSARDVRRAIRTEIRKWKSAQRELPADSRDDGPDWSRPAGKWQRLGKNAFSRIWRERVAFNGRTCTEDDWSRLWSDRGSSLGYWLNPDVPGQTEDERWEERHQRLRDQVRSDLRWMTPRSIQSLMAVGVGRMDVCVIGDHKGSDPTLIAEAVKGKPERGAYYKAEFAGKVLFYVRWHAMCEGEAVEFDTRGVETRRISLRLAVSPSKGKKRAHHKVEFDRTDAEDTPEHGLVQSAYDTASAEARDGMLSWTGDLQEDTRCTETYRKRFTEGRTRWMTNHITSQSDVTKAVDAYNERAAEANAYLRAWIGLALHDAAPFSDVVTVLATGSARFPQWEYGNTVVWDDRIQQGIAVVEALLQSDEFFEMAQAHSGYGGITDTVYDTLDPEHPLVRASKVQGRSGASGGPSPVVDPMSRSHSHTSWYTTPSGTEPFTATEMWESQERAGNSQLDVARGQKRGFVPPLGEIVEGHRSDGFGPLAHPPSVHHERNFEAVIGRWSIPWAGRGGSDPKWGGTAEKWFGAACVAGRPMQGDPTCRPFVQRDVRRAHGVAARAALCQVAIPRCGQVHSLCASLPEMWVGGDESLHDPHLLPPRGPNPPRQRGAGDEEFASGRSAAHRARGRAGGGHVHGRARKLAKASPRALEPFNPGVYPAGVASTRDAAGAAERGQSRRRPFDLTSRTDSFTVGGRFLAVCSCPTRCRQNSLSARRIR